MNEEIDFKADSIKKAFKAYDIRGKIPDELNSTSIKYIGNAFAQFLNKKGGAVVVGYDVRPTSKEFSTVLIQGICDAGFDVIDIGLCGTDMVYYATATLEAIGGVMITASHNPADYNGLKFVKENSKPISGETGLFEIRDLVLSKSYLISDTKGHSEILNITQDYISHILSFIEKNKIPQMKVVMNAGNGCAGVILPELMKHLPQIELVKVFWEPDGTFPNGIPNPLLPDKRKETADHVLKQSADLGVAWDGDFDRCFFYDNEGNFIEGYYLVALYAQAILQTHPGSKIIHDPRLVWATIDVVKNAGGVPVVCRSGHSFIKEKMREEDAIYAGEMSAHHYFKENFYADNGMIPMLILFQILGESGQSLHQLVSDWMEKYPVSGEINIRVSDAKKVLKIIEEKYIEGAIAISHIDGVSIEYETWRFNLRISNTEPVIRLNVETRQDRDLMETKRDELISVIKSI